MLVPAKTNIILFTYQLHRDPEQFPNPNKFDPERFGPSNTRQKHAYSYVPFSAGELTMKFESMMFIVA